MSGNPVTSIAPWVFMRSTSLPNNNAQEILRWQRADVRLGQKPTFASQKGMSDESVRKASGGNEPEIAWFETGVVVDNESHQIKTATQFSTTAIAGSSRRTRAFPLWGH